MIKDEVKCHTCDQILFCKASDEMPPGPNCDDWLIIKAHLAQGHDVREECRGISCN